jgi:murein DD-endopeptidase MepM/ murein hydrolase activator NlpD
VSTDVTQTAPTTALLSGTGALSASALTTAARTNDRAQVVRLAKEFESFVMLQMIRQMRQAMLDENRDQGLGSDTMFDTMDVELARQLAASGGIGLASALQSTIERQTLGGETGPAGQPGSSTDGGQQQRNGQGTREPVAATPGVAGSERRETASVALPLPLHATLTSHYGYRADPFDGSARFHAGVDLGAVYGQEVPAVAVGHVVFSGAQAGYGNVVIIEHADGVQTKYAHLSSIQVEAGDSVEVGSVIGRVGSSGRSTGPHLHFEVLQSGHQVDPEVAATRYAGLLKFGRVDADLTTSQPSTLGWPQE